MGKRQTYEPDWLNKRQRAWHRGKRGVPNKDREPIHYEEVVKLRAMHAERKELRKKIYALCREQGMLGLTGGMGVERLRLMYQELLAKKNGQQPTEALTMRTLFEEE